MSRRINRDQHMRGIFSSESEPETVPSDDGIDYVDWEAMEEAGWPLGREREFTYRIIDGERVHFRNGVQV